MADQGSERIDGLKGPLDLIQESLYGFAYVMSKKVAVEQRVFVVLITIDALQ